jgi:4-hydroxybenzoate polyprenyltransferase
MASTRVSVADVLSGIAAPPKRSSRNRIVGFITLQRVGLCVAVLPFPLGVAALAGAKFNLELLPLIIVAFLGGTAASMTNDIVDMERDKRKWPLKPLATGLVSRSEAVFYTVILAGLALAIAAFVFNLLFTALLLIALGLSYVYARYARDAVGYLTIIPVFACLPLAIWGGISPSTILTPLPWLIVIFGAAWTSAVQITHEGLDPTIPALVVRPRPAVEGILYIAAVLVMLLVGMAIFLYTRLSPLYLVALATLIAWMLIYAKDLGESRSREKLESAYKIIFASISFYFLLIAIFVWTK